MLVYTNIFGAVLYFDEISTAEWHCIPDKGQTLTKHDIVNNIARENSR